jgi:hypothetical protein
VKQAALDTLVKLAQEANDSDRWWEFADGLDDKVREAIGDPDGAHAPSGKSHARDDSHAVFAEISDAILDELGILYTVDRLRGLRATALAWPPEERDREVEFAVHQRLRGSKAKPKLAMYKRRAAADYKRSPGFIRSPRLTIHRLKVYRADEGRMVPWDLQQQRRIRSLVSKASSLAELDAIRDMFATACKDRRRELT